MGQLVIGTPIGTPRLEEWVYTADRRAPVFHAEDQSTEAAFGLDGRKEFLAMRTAVLGRWGLRFLLLLRRVLVGLCGCPRRADGGCTRAHWGLE